MLEDITNGQGRGALLRVTSEIVGTPSNFTIFSFCHFIKGYGLADPYEAHGSVDTYELNSTF